MCFNLISVFLLCFSREERSFALLLSCLQRKKMRFLVPTGKTWSWQQVRRQRIKLLNCWMHILYHCFAFREIDRENRLVSSFSHFWLSFRFLLSWQESCAFLMLKLYVLQWAGCFFWFSFHSCWSYKQHSSAVWINRDLYCLLYLFIYF